MQARNIRQNLLLAGTAAIPGLAFLNDYKLGLFRKAANQLGFTVNGTEIGYMSSNGLNGMGIGQTTTGAVSSSSGALNGTIGATTPAAGVFTTMNSSAVQTIASSGTTNIGNSATSNEIIISGTTTITSFGAGVAGMRRNLYFSGILTLTSGGSLIVPGGSSITTAAGDCCSVRYTGSAWVVTDYQKASGEALVAGAGGTTIPSGTAMLFQQTAAPTGFTKQVTHNDKALRVVTGAASSGGTTAFSSVMASRTPTGSVNSVSGAVSVSGSVGNTTLSTGEMPSHSHSISPTFYGPGFAGAQYGPDPTPQYDTSFPQSAAAAGSGGAHGHSWSGSGSFSGATGAFAGGAMDFAIQYVDLIIATKD